jgi:hypothetical protein
MSKLTNVEKIEKVLFTIGSNFSVKNAVITGTKGKDNIKLNPIYSREYNSTKYSDKSQLEQITVRTSDYIVLSYNDFQNRVNEEIYISYPHMSFFLEKLEEAVRMVNTPDMFKGNNINPKYQDLVIKLDNLGGQKSIAFIPHVIQNDQNYSYGVLLFLNSDEVYIEIDANNLYTLYYILKDFNLNLNSSILLLTGLLYDSGVGSVDDTPVFGGTTNKSPFGGTVNRAPRGIFGNKSSNISSKKDFKPPVKNTTIEDLDKAIEDENISDEDLPFTGGEPSDKQNNSPLSLNNIMDAANEIEIPDLEDDIDF